MQGLHGIQKLFNLDYQVSEVSCSFSLKLIETGAGSREFWFSLYGKGEQRWRETDLSNSNVKLITSLPSPRVGGGVAPCTMFYTGRLFPEVQPITLLYTILKEKFPISY